MHTENDQYIEDESPYGDTTSNQLKLPQLVGINQQSNSLSTKKKQPKAARFIFSKETKKEFGLKEVDIPVQMREELDKNAFNDHVEQNIKVTERYNDLNKIVYLSKIKFNMETQIQNKDRA